MSQKYSERLRQLAKQYKCPWGDPGSNPDYFSPEEYSLVLEVAELLEKQVRTEDISTVKESSGEVQL